MGVETPEIVNSHHGKCFSLPELGVLHCLDRVKADIIYKHWNLLSRRDFIMVNVGMDKRYKARYSTGLGES